MLISLDLNRAGTRLLDRGTDNSEEERKLGRHTLEFVFLITCTVLVVCTASKYLLSYWQDSRKKYGKLALLVQLEIHGKIRAIS